MCYTGTCPHEVTDIEGDCRCLRPPYFKCPIETYDKSYECEQCGYVDDSGVEPEQCAVCGSDDVVEV